MTTRIQWKNTEVVATPLEACAAELLFHVEESTWSQGLGAPTTAIALRRALDDAFKIRPEAKK